ncbi:MAG: hypothetical protein R3F07_12470 [Opitutaceae bacterium]
MPPGSHSPILQPERLRRLYIDALESRAEAILASGHPGGRFGTEPWIVRDQDVILPLALLYKFGPEHRKGNPELLGTIAAAGCYLRERQDARGMYLFNKKDGSEWGMIFMPWTYLRWMITYDLLADDLAEEDRQTWEEGLRLGYAGISETELSSSSNIYPGPLPGQAPPPKGEFIPWIHNIPCHHAAGLYLAGKRFGREDWMSQARSYQHQVVAAQSPHGWWTEHSGPVVLYNRVYLEALAIYFQYSGDPVVGDALRRGNTFHLHFTYPDGSSIETIDERNPYPPIEYKTEADGSPRWLPRLMFPHPGLYASADGVVLLKRLLDALEARGARDLDNAEYLFLCLPDGGLPEGAAGAPASQYAMGDKALVVNEGPWTLCLSAYCATRTPNRFIQDRQNLVSVFHRDLGIILGGGNTKIQPLWSTMTVGDTRLVSPAGSTRETDLAPETALSYVPYTAVIVGEGGRGVGLTIGTGGALLRIGLRVISDNALEWKVCLEKAAPDGSEVANHLTFIRYPESPVIFSDRSSADLGMDGWSRSGLEWIGHHGWRLTLPSAARISWPVLPHNPYTGDGKAAWNEGRLVVTLPFEREGDTFTLHLSRE